MLNNVQYALIGGGYVLQEVARQLPVGSFVITSRRQEAVDSWRKAGWHAECFDFSDPSQIPGLFQRYSNLNVWVDSVPPFSGIEASIEAISANISINLKRILYLSTTGVYGVTDGSWVDEETALNPAHTRADARVFTEQSYQQIGIPVCALRISGIYGPGRGAGLALKRGSYPYVDQGMRWSNRINVYDLANSIKAAIEFDRSRKLPPAINVSDSCPSLVRDVVEYYCTKFNLKMPTSIDRQEHC